MSTWNDIKEGFRTVTNQVICRTDALAEKTALSIKKKNIEAHLAAAYEKVGKIAYQLASEGEFDAIPTNEEFLKASREVEQRLSELRDIEKQIREFQEKSDSEEKK